VSGKDTVSKAGRDAWRVWDDETEYGRLLFKRATGELPEMESSKAVADIVKGLLQPGDRILDVGCGAGHYLKSLRTRIDLPFSYTGVDATVHYIELAREAWQKDRQANFEVGDVFSLPFRDESYEIVLSCNLLHHLPSIQTPLQELVRVCRKHALIRTLVGDRSFRIQEVRSQETYPNSLVEEPEQEEFDDNGEPRQFNFFNIYSKSYFEKLLSGMPNVDSYHIDPDNTFDSASIEADACGDAAPNATQMYGSWQVNGYILQPWSFVSIARRSTESDAGR